MSTVKAEAFCSRYASTVKTRLAPCGYVLPGYGFTGWNTKADGSGTAYADEGAVKNLATEQGAVVALYAQWEEPDPEL